MVTHINTFRVFLFILSFYACFFIGMAPGFGQTFRFQPREESNMMTAEQMKAHDGQDTIIVVQSRWNEMLSYGNSWRKFLKFKSIHDFVKFYVNPAYPVKVTQPYTFRLTYLLYGYPDMSDTGVYVRYADTLTISYHPDSLGVYQDAQYKKYSNFHKIMIVLTGLYEISDASSPPVPVDISPSSNFAQLNFNVEGSILVQPYQLSRPGFGGGPVTVYGADMEPLFVSAQSPVDDYIAVSWRIDQYSPVGAIPVEPAYYELEWTYVDNYRVDPATGTVSAISEGGLGYDFSGNSTRVVLDTNYYRIPLIYQRGYLLYRVRMVRPDSSFYSAPVYGPWSLAGDFGSVSTVSNNHKYQIAEAHLHDSLNWQYTVSFAEGGRFKQVLSYYDGMLKNRQSITRFNSRPNMLLATGLYYDYEGRPSLSILPTPVPSSGFRYRPSLALNSATGLPYRPADFDAIIAPGLCPAEQVLPPLSAGSAAHIYYSSLNPDQSGFRKFIPDAGGYPLVETIYRPGDDRIEKQGGAGDSLQIGFGHTTQNNYVSPTQMELNRLFGLGIGQAGFYRKTVSRDPNGQYAFQITDFRGKTIASALIGEPDTLTHALTLNEDLPDSSNYREDFLAGAIQQHKGNKLVLDKAIFNEAAGNNSAQYIYHFNPFPTFCPNLYLSVKAAFNYSVFDACGDLEVHDDGVLGTTGVMSSAQVIPYTAPQKPFYMDQGQHTIHKELKVNPDDIAQAVDDFMALPPSENCMKTEQQFIREAVEARTFPCSEPPSSDCDRKKKLMMAQLWPNLDGKDDTRKYGFYTYGETGDSVVGNGNSIFDILEYSPWDVGYRYQTPCLNFHFPDTVYKDGRAYTNIAQLPVDTLIAIFNDDIAEALLPLHPEYCNLAYCSEDYFARKLQSISDAAMAEELGLLYLDSIINADPVYAGMQDYPYMRYPSPYDTLANVWGGGYRLDLKALQDAYCSCSDAIMGQACRDSVFADEIASGTLINDYVKERYFKEIVPLYLANRQKYIHPTYFSSGDEICQTCEPSRLKQEYPPVFVSFVDDPPLFNENFDDWGKHISPGSTDSLDWRDLIGDDSTSEERARRTYDTIQGQLCTATIEHILGQLVNCTGTPVQMDGVRDSLTALCERGEAPFGNYTPRQVRRALVDNGISLDDLCNPYVVGYDPMDPYAGMGQGDFDCRPAVFYTGVMAILNDPVVSGVLDHPGTVSSYVIPGDLNFFGQELADSLMPGAPAQTPAAVSAVYDASDGLYVLRFSYMGDTVRIYLHSGACGAFFSPQPGASVSVTSVSCMQRLPGGYIGRYAFSLNVRAEGSGQDETCRMTAWTDRIQMNGLPPAGSNPFEDCVPCTRMSNLYAEFTDTLKAYGIYGVDHPYYTVMLNNFMNDRLQQIFTAAQYERFIESCALADSTMLYRYGAPYFIKQLDTAKGNDFLIDFENAFPKASAPFMRIKEPGGLNVFYFDPHSIPLEELKAFRSFLSDYPVFVVPKGINSFVDSGVDKMGRLYISTADTFVPSGAIFDQAPFSFIAQSGVYGISFSGSARADYKVYEVRSPSGASPAQQSVNVQRLGAYLYDHGVNGYFLPFREATVGPQYALPEKQAFLQYVYQYKDLPPGQVLDSMQPAVMQAHVPLYGSSKLRYGTPLQPGAIQDLYISDAAASGSGFDRLSFMFNTVAGAFSGGKIIFKDNPKHVLVNSGGLQLIAYRCSDGSYWYRYFGAGDTLYNVYFKVPDYIDTNDIGEYSFGDLGADAGDNNPFSFTLRLYNPQAAVPEIEMTGLADFEIAQGVQLEDVLLTHPLNKGIPAGPDIDDNCEQTELKAAVYEGQVKYRLYLDSVRRKLYNDFYAYIMNGGIEEQLLSGFAGRQFNYTLYDYDRAGNLTGTVPPAGVRPLAAGMLNLVDNVRSAGTYDASLMPGHRQQSRYRYNTLNQAVMQETPDGGRTQLFYDAAGRPVFSQNARQRPEGLMSYTLYDGQGRVTETGEAHLACGYFPPYPSANGYIKPELTCAYYDAANGQITPFPPQVSNLPAYTQAQISSFVRAYNRKDVVLTVYDGAIADTAAVAGLPAQHNLRHRVASVLYYKQLLPGANLYRAYAYGMHFSYDVAGNVQTLVRDYPAWKVYHQRFKRVDYDYDLISGKVNMLSYNRGYPDQYYQRYRYDADNRLTAVESSAEGMLWQQDARYDYYDHGPLARLSLGDRRVQGVDYAYTIQGWLKAINGDDMKPADEMGGDGLPGSNDITARDAYALTLDYFKGDYKPIGNAALTHTPPLAKGLYNGNIPRSSLGTLAFPVLSAAYTYDQMNRLVRTQYARLEEDSTLSPLDDYYNTYAYDPNGNLQTLTRKGNATGGIVHLMDSLSYFYDPAGQDNRLLNLTDAAADVAAYGNDIKQFTTTGVERYRYDATGNVIKDLVSGQDSIEWNLYNKVARVRQDVQQRELLFGYDGAGNRYMKINRRTDDTSRSERDDYYVRDAQGNILATYRAETEYDTAGNWSNWMLELNNDIRNQIGGEAFLAHIREYYGGNNEFKHALIDFIINYYNGGYDILYNYPVGFYVEHNYAVKAYAIDKYIGMEYFYTWMINYYNQTGRHILAEAMTEMFLQDPAMMNRLLDNLPVSNEVLTKELLSQLCFPAENGNDDVMTLIANHLLYWGSINCDWDVSYIYDELVQQGPGFFTDGLSQLLDDSTLSEGDVREFFRRVLSDYYIMQQTPDFIDNEEDLIREALLDYTNNKDFAEYVDFVGTMGMPMDINILVNFFYPQDLLPTVYDHDLKGFLDFWLSGYYDFFVIDQALSQMTGINYHSYLRDWDGIYTLPDKFLSKIIKRQKISLSSHVLYGSSRLGVKQYMPGQFYAQWDYTQALPVIDTAFLTQRVPWYSLAQNDFIQPDAESPIGHIDTSIYAMQHQLGITQYELTNHLGNVQATVTDNRVPNWVGNDSVDYYKPAVAAAYDYYPYGMLMPGRYVQDTSAKCMTVSANKWMVTPETICKDNSDTWPWFPVEENKYVMFIPVNGLQMLYFHAPYAQLKLNIPKGSGSTSNLRTLKIELDGVVPGVTFALISESDDDTLFCSQQQISGQNPVVNMEFRPSGHHNEKIMLYIFSPTPNVFNLFLRSMCLTEEKYSSQSVLVDVCNDMGDRYPFGFNGQEKVNEWAGMGNHNTAKFWEYDTRTGRRYNLDPKPHLSLSSYSVFSGNPIINVDILGDTDRVANYYMTKGKKPGELNKRYYSNSQSQSDFQSDWDLVKADLMANGFGELVSYIESCEETIHIVKATGLVGSHWARTSQGIMLVYNPRGGLKTTTGRQLSPRSVLVHELAHGVDDIQDPFIHFLRSSISSIYYLTLEEMRVTKTWEQKAARKFDNLLPFDITRSNHSGEIIQTFEFYTNEKVGLGESAPMGYTPKKSSDEENGKTKSGQKVILNTGDNSDPIYYQN